ncbi:AfsR/SARP family transcriptional regulator [Nonomuraea rubra]|uniref:Putative ATPase/DNA-binding SARP family transcriptional activator n=1 Tax=Nonomuraea rubra TaxID=46180 RepID=A0A7X0U4Q9_9ACTN|nr:BTAD domain-containing putative transcriptional regulator [Nonomuraea rubra]MBB6554730.1 putative ATPase/DNA-binding SARP family transcriptional activator [Nonomuraea rubra]
MRFQILGPTNVLGEDGEPVTLGGPRVRALLTLLALHAGRVVGAEQLVDGMYGHRPPEGVANALQSQVSRLRRALGRDLVEFHPAGYRLVADPGDVDARRFELLTSEGRQALAGGDPARAAALLREGLELWRGAPLADAPHAEAAAAALEELRLAATEDRAQAELDLGRHRELVAELSQLTAAHPLRERLRAQLMRALYGSGRQAEALTVYEETRKLLDEELGIEPGAELAAAHLAVLRADPALGPTHPPALTTTHPPTPPPTSGGSYPPAPPAALGGAHPAAPGAAQSTAPGSAYPPALRAAHPAAPGPTHPAAPGAGLGDGVGAQGVGGQAARQGLRAQLTSFVGRAEELAQVGARLRDSRLVTLIGPGGAGKTRLAIETAAQEPGDVCFVPLAPVSDGDGVPQAVLAALGIRDAVLLIHERPTLDPEARLVAALAGRELLLVLDNCEHLVSATAELADHLLAACPDLRVLVTGREALGITGESILPVAPLRLPPTETDEPLGYPSVRLFADRAAAVRPGFAVDAGNAGHVVRICRALDGLPLAIELAAARLRTLSVADVAARLDDRFRLLTRGSRTALPRHQTLHAVVAWSWDLLDEDEQVMARRLSTFVAGARPEVAERVCGLPEEVLFSLAEKSLVEFADGRFRMLETIRAFCAERLEESGEAATTRDAHARYYLDLLRTADPLLRTGAQMEWLARLDEESGDLDAAVRWATESGQFELGVRLLAHSACYWWMRGHRTASANLAAALLAALGERRLPGLEEEYGMCVLVMAWAGGMDEPLRTRLAEVRRLLPIDYVPVRVEFMMMLLSMFTGPPTDFGEMQQFYMDAVSGLSPWKQALAYCGHAFVLQVLGRIDEALDRFEQSLAGFRAIGERWGMVLVLSGLGALRQKQGDYRAALALADEVLALARELGSATETAEGLCRRGDARSFLSGVQDARADYAEAAELSRRNGSMETLAWALLGLGLVEMERGDLDAARALLVEAREVCPGNWYSTEETRARIDAALAEIGNPIGGPLTGPVSER